VAAKPTNTKASGKASPPAVPPNEQPPPGTGGSGGTAGSGGTGGHGGAPGGGCSFGGTAGGDAFPLAFVFVGFAATLLRRRRRA